MKVLQFGNDPSSPGGVASVVSEMAAWSGAHVSVTTSATYFHGDRRRTSVALLRSLLMAVASRHEIWHIHMTQKGSFIREGVFVALGRWRRRKVTVTIHGSGFTDFARRRPQIVRRVLGRADVVFVLSVESADTLKEVCPATTTAVVPNMIQVDDEVLPDSGARQGFVFAGEVGHRKGVDALLNAWKMANTYGQTLTLCGATAEGFELSEWLPASGVEFVGQISRSELRDRLRNARFAILPSRAEALPMFVLEALSVGAVPVTSQVGQLGQLVSSLGFLVDPGNSETLAAEISRLSDPQLDISELSEKCRAMALERFDTSAVRSTFLAHWARLLA